MRNIILTAIFLSLFFAGRSFCEETEPGIFIKKFIELYNSQDWETIYKDVTTGRFKASQDFTGFQDSMQKAKDLLGPAEYFEIVTAGQDEHENIDYYGQKLSFYRFEAKMKHQKGEALHRFVIMKNEFRGLWEMDGYGIAQGENILFAQGNLYQSPSVLKIPDKQSPLDANALMSNPNWEDSKTEYIKQKEKELQGVVDEGVSREEFWKEIDQSSSNMEPRLQNFLRMEKARSNIGKVKQGVTTEAEIINWFGPADSTMEVGDSVEAGGAVTEEDQKQQEEFLKKSIPFMENPRYPFLIGGEKLLVYQIQWLFDHPQACQQAAGNCYIGEYRVLLFTIEKKTSLVKHFADMSSNFESPVNEETTKAVEEMNAPIKKE